MEKSCKKPRIYEAELELKLVSGMTAKSRLQNLADVQRLIEKHHLTAGFAEHLNPYVRNKFIELLP